MRGDTNTRSNAGGIKQDLKRIVLRRLLKRVDHFLCVGEANRQFYLRQGVCEDQLASAPHCVDNSRFAAQADAMRSERDALRKRWEIPASAFCVLFCGKLVEKKRPLDLVEAVKRLNGTAAGKPVHVLFAGAGELEAALRNAADGQPVTFAASSISPRSFRPMLQPTASCCRATRRKPGAWSSMRPWRPAYRA